MLFRKLLIGLSVTGLLASTSLPASAQVTDFLCSTFSISCPEPPPPAPPPPPPPAEPAPTPVKHKRHAHRKAKKTAEPAADTGAEPAAAK